MRGHTDEKQTFPTRNNGQHPFSKTEKKKTGFRGEIETQSYLRVQLTPED